ncbi:MAG: hypothetical protein AB1540_13665 [Bdellovibrionota bacterium]
MIVRTVLKALNRDQLARALFWIGVVGLAISPTLLKAEGVGDAVSLATPVIQGAISSAMAPDRPKNGPGCTLPKEQCLSQAEQLCASRPSENHLAYDACHGVEVKRAAVDAQYVSAGAYAAASTVCLTECLLISTGIGMATGSAACSWSGVAAMGADVTASAVVLSKGKQAMRNIMVAVPTVIGGVMFLDDKDGFFNMDFGGPEEVDPNNLPKDQTLEEAQKKAQEEYAKKAQSAACWGAATNAAQAAVRGGNIFLINKEVENDLLSTFDIPKTEVVGANLGSASPSTATGKHDAPTQMSPQTGNPIKSAAGKPSGEKLAESAVNAGQGPLLKHFENLTGKPAHELFDRIVGGQPPLLAATEMASGALGESGVSAALQLHAASGDIAEKLGEEVTKKDVIAQQVFEHSSASRSGGKSSGGPVMPDLQSLIGALMPKKTDAAKAQGPTGPKLAAHQVAQVQAQGLHVPEESLFEVVRSRYHLVAPKFLAGDAITSGRNPASFLPTNIYLRK